MLDGAKLVGKKLCQGKNDYKTGGSFKVYFSPLKKYVLTIDNHGILEQHMTFKGFNDSERLLNRSQYFDILEGKKYQPCYQGIGNNHSIMVSLYL